MRDHTDADERGREESDRDRDDEEWDDSLETPLRYRIVEAFRDGLIATGKVAGKLIYASLAATASLFISFFVLSFWLGTSLMPGESGLIEALTAGMRNLNPLLDSMTALESEFAILFAMMMFWCGVATWWSYTRAVGFVQKL